MAIGQYGEYYDFAKLYKKGFLKNIFKKLTSGQYIGAESC